jgi:hypothetical protein
MSSIKTQSAWKDVNGVFVKVGGQWKTVTESYVKVNGVWKLTTFSTGPEAAPQMTHAGFGKFRIVNYDPNLVYETEFVGGDNRVDGSVSRSGDTFTLGSTQSAYNVYSRFVANGPRSPAGYMERRRITFTFIAQCFYVSQTCFRTIDESYPATPIFGTLTGNVSDCQPLAVFCRPGETISGPSGDNRCFCVTSGFQFRDVGFGRCPGGAWYNCGNRCCIDGQIVGYSCPNGGNLSGTTCVKSRQEPFECGYWQSCNNENPVPAGYNRSPGTANVQGEWWRVTR